MSKLVGAVVKGISTGVGLASEKYTDHKTRKAALAESGQSSYEETEAVAGEESVNDERMWSLDEVAGPPPAYEALASDPNGDNVIAQLAHDVSGAHVRQVQLYGGQVPRLPHPVIIPQRRPGSKSRGWTRAYAPDLEPLGIEQDTFLHFLASWEKVATASPWLKAIGMTSDIVGMAMPTPIVMGITTAISVSAMAAMAVETRYKTNTFLDKMNMSVFMPAGLYAMVIVCKQEASAGSDITLTIEDASLENAKNISAHGLPGTTATTAAKFKRSMRGSSGQANVDDMPLEIAPLIYPALDDMMRHPEVTRDETFKERLMRNKNFVGEYFDRRAQADFMGNNPDATLSKAAGDMPEFTSRFADPNHACNNGNLVTLVTGGKYVVQGRGLGMRGGRGGGRGARRGMREDTVTDDGRGRGGLLFRGGRGPVAGLIHRARSSGSKEEFNVQEQSTDHRYNARGGRGGLLGASNSQYREVGEDGRLLPRQKEADTPVRGPIGMVMKGAKKVFKPDVMYLTIVNLPTNDEIEQAKEALGMDKKGWQDLIDNLKRR